ncbi:MAG: response regulator transcription factor [Bdellovibrio sp.]|nr:response regulator transcription factor [Bdellovibrio sp.]
MAKILLVEDDANLGASLEKYLRGEGQVVLWAKNLQAAREMQKESPTLIILDWMLPDGQGIDFLREKQARHDPTPVIMLTAKTDLVDRVLGLESGANDYVTKPFEPRELLARIRVQERNSQGRPKEAPAAKIIEINGIQVDLLRHEVSFQGKLVELTKMEFELLRLLMENPNRAFGREELLNKVWGYENYPTTRTVDTHVLQLRQKFYDDLIETVRGIGYRLRSL